jgi:hypothetical protein
VDPYQTNMPQTDLFQPKSKLYETKKLSDKNDRSSAIEGKVENLTSSRLTAWIG